MSKASSVVASVTQQSIQRVQQSRTEYRERQKATWVQMVRRQDKLMTSGGAYSRWRLCAISETGTQSATFLRLTVII